MGPRFLFPISRQVETWIPNPPLLSTFKASKRKKILHLNPPISEVSLTDRLALTFTSPQFHSKSIPGFQHLLSTSSALQLSSNPKGKSIDSCDLRLQASGQVTPKQLSQVTPEQWKYRFFLFAADRMLVGGMRLFLKLKADPAIPITNSLTSYFFQVPPQEGPPHHRGPPLNQGLLFQVLLLQQGLLRALNHQNINHHILNHQGLLQSVGEYALRNP